MSQSSRPSRPRANSGSRASARLLPSPRSPPDEAGFVAFGGWEGGFAPGVSVTVTVTVGMIGSSERQDGGEREQGDGQEDERPGQNLGAAEGLPKLADRGVQPMRHHGGRDDVVGHRDEFGDHLLVGQRPVLLPVTLDVSPRPGLPSEPLLLFASEPLLLFVSHAASKSSAAFGLYPARVSQTWRQFWNVWQAQSDMVGEEAVEADALRAWRLRARL